MRPSTLREAVEGLASSSRAVVTGLPPDPIRLSYPELLERILSLGVSLRRQGLHPGDRVVMRIGNSLDDLVMLLTIIHVGAVPVSIKPYVPDADETAYVGEIVQQQQARYSHGVTHPGLVSLHLSPTADSTRPDSHPLPAAVDPDSVAFVQYTSGSTGRPRPVPLSHRALLTNIRGIGSVPRVRTIRTGMVVVPLHHDMGLVGALSCFVNDLNLYLLETSAFLRRPVRCLELAATLNVTETAMPDFLLQFLTKRLNDKREVPATLLQSWDTIYCGAEPIREQTVQAFVKVAEPLGLDATALTFCYGLAEAALLVSAHRYVNDAASFDHAVRGRPACLGQPIAGVEIRVCSQGSTEEAEEGDVGAVHLRGDTMFNGYDSATDHRVEWFDTGDLGYFKDGDLYLSGRRTDLITINGSNIFVTDIEKHVLRTQDASECVVLPAGESFTVLVVPQRQDCFDPDAIAESVTAAFAISPTAVSKIKKHHIVRTASGKPIRGVMADRLLKEYG